MDRAAVRCRIASIDRVICCSILALCSYGIKRTANPEKSFFSVLSTRFIPWLALRVALILGIGIKEAGLGIEANFVFALRGSRGFNDGICF